MAPSKATIDWDGYELLVKFSPYHPAIAEDFKSSIPQHSRRWDPDDKCWRISTIYKELVEQIFEDYDYAVRDFTGDDPAAKVRQAGLRAEREKRLNDQTAKQQKRAEERERRAREQEEARQRAERARRDDRSWAETEREWREGSGFYKDFRDAYEGQFGEGTFEKLREEEIKMRKRFFEVNPHLDERHWKMWWNWYKQYGRDEANTRFMSWMQEKQDFQRRWQNFFGNGQKSIDAKLRDAYRVLGIKPPVTLDTARSAYRQKAMEHHPDRNPNNKDEAQKRMVEVNLAWEVIQSALK